MILMACAAASSLAVRVGNVAESLREAPADVPAPVLLALDDLRRAGDILDVCLFELVEEARGRGVSWEGIGRQLGVSRQAAHARFAVVADEL